ncbi:hypothetical protein PMAYCL1PPCAC_03026, partial [Pristionchus mayeri]
CLVMAWRIPPTGRSSRNSSRTTQPLSDSDDEFVERHTRSSTARMSGGGARGAPPPSTRGRTAASRGRATGRNRASAGTASVRGNRLSATRPRGGPIFGGRQNQVVRRATGAQRAISGAGRAYRTRRSNSNANGDLDGTIVLDDEEDSNEEGEDVEVSDEDEDEDQRDYDLEDSFINDESILENANETFQDPFGDGDDDVFDSFINDLLDGGDNDDLDGEMGGEGRNNPDESFSQEQEEFELMEERENAAAKRAESRLRKREDKEEKENKNALRTDMFGACTVCAEEEVTDPVGCLHCANFIGCRKCANRWFRTSKNNDPNKIGSCPFCRHQWTSSVPEVGDMLDLVRS